MTGNTSLSEFAFYRYRNLIIVSAVLVYGLVAYLSYATGITWLPLLAIGVFFAGVFAFLSLKEPYYILLFVAVGSYLGNLVHLIEDGAVPVTIFQILLVMGFLFFVVHRLMASDLEIKLLGIELELMLFLALIFLSIVYTPNPESGMLNAIRFLILIATAYLVVNIVRSQNQITGILALLVAVSVVLAAIALRETILNPTAAAMEFMSAGNLENRAKGTQVDPNIFASHFFLPIAFVSSLFLSLKSYMYRVPAFIILGILSLGLLSTFSRSAWVAAAVMLVLTAYFQRQLKLFVWLFGVALVAILFIPELQYTALNVLERIMDIFAGSSDNSSRIRILLGIAAMGMLFDSYLLGVGFRGFPEVFPNYFSVQSTIGVVEPHNITYTILAELGVIGFFLFAIIYWKIGWVAYQNITLSTGDVERSVSITLFVAYIAFIIFYQFYNGFLVDTNIWIIIGLIFAMNLIKVKPLEYSKGELT